MHKIYSKSNKTSWILTLVEDTYFYQEAADTTNYRKPQTTTYNTLQHNRQEIFIVEITKLQKEIVKARKGQDNCFTEKGRLTEQEQVEVAAETLIDSFKGNRQLKGSKMKEPSNLQCCQWCHL